VMLWELYTHNPAIRAHVDQNLVVFNGKPGRPKSLRLLEGLLLEQYFRLSFWKVATEEINYRRFFNINSLISLRVEDSRVLDHTHSLIFQLIEEGRIHGLRIDHVDGLYDPTAYLQAIRKLVGDTYVVVEKILALEEEVPEFWPIHGTTGYEFMNVVNGLFCEQRNEKAFDRIYARFTGLNIDFDDLVFQKKELIAEKHMAGDVDNLARLIKAISSRYRRGSDITLNGLRRAIVQVLAVFPVYRTYLSKEFSRSQDVLYIQESLEELKEKNPDLSHELDFIKDLLLPDFGRRLSRAERAEWIHTVMRFQQFTGPLMAKGLEDTALYLYNRLISLNTVGGDPNTFGISCKYFHRLIKKRFKFHPHSMNASATHDGKRGEDVRARINILSEIPHEWEKAVRTWKRINRKYCKDTKQIKMPESNDEYFLYQTLVGALPFFKGEYEEIDIQEFIKRIKEYVVKAAREGKLYTSWLRPDMEYEDTLLSFVEALMTTSPDNQFLGSFLPFQKKVALYGIWNSLSQTLIKITSPGVPDFYQGTELWDLSLVDPDNRRPVDFRSRKAHLRDILGRRKQRPAFLEELLATREDGRIKLYLIHAALVARKKYAEVFQRGSYLPLTVSGIHKNHVIAAARRYRQAWTITVVPRFLTGLVEADAVPIGQAVWSDTNVLLPARAPKAWANALTGEKIESDKTLPMARLCNRFPVALLINSTATEAR
jgi:(1->4)-alpha-D-glucan 1-alpha-D-glucosylmutase